MDASQLIQKHEGFRTTMYRDSMGIPTIGVGHNLRDKPISVAAVNQIFADDLGQVKAQLSMYPWFQGIGDVRQAVLLDMAFNMGINGLLKFEGMIAALGQSDFGKAADEMLDSAWAKQVATRAAEDAGLMRSGSWT